MSRDSNTFANNLLVKAQNVANIRKSLETEPDIVVQELETLRHAMIDTRRMRVSVEGDILLMMDPVGTWMTHFLPVDGPNAQHRTGTVAYLPVTQTSEVLVDLARNPSRKMHMYDVAGIDSAFGTFVTKGPSVWDHDDAPAVAVTCEILSAMEGPLWDAVRGAGLVYGISIDMDTETGHLMLTMDKSPDVYKAWQVARATIHALASGDELLVDRKVQAAKSIYAYKLASARATYAQAAWSSFTEEVIFGKPKDYPRLMLSRLQGVTAADVLRILNKYMLTLFRPETSIACVAAGSTIVEAQRKKFASEGFEVVNCRF